MEVEPGAYNLPPTVANSLAPALVSSLKTTVGELIVLFKLRVVVLLVLASVGGALFTWVARCRQIISFCWSSPAHCHRRALPQLISILSAIAMVRCSAHVAGRWRWVVSLAPKPC